LCISLQADVEFKDTTKKDTLLTLEDELQRLLSTAKDENKEVRVRAHALPLIV
jgi:hypothetical protein